MSLNGIEATPDGLLKSTWTTTLPEYYKVKPWTQKQLDSWYQTLAAKLNGPPGNYDTSKTTNIDVKYLWENRNRVVPPADKNITWPLSVIAALEQFIDKDKAEALGNWLVGNYMYDGWTGLSNRAYDASDFIDAKNCRGANNPGIHIDWCLDAIKAANPAAHDWVLRAASAKLSKKKAHESIMYDKIMAKQAAIVAKPIEVVGTAAVKTIEAATSGVEKGLSILPWIAGNIWWIAPVVGGTFLFIAWKNKDKIARAAVAIETGGASEILRKNTGKRRRRK